MAYNREKVLDDEDRDEHYTKYTDIANELSLYADQFRDKTIICPCDWDEVIDEKLVFKNGEWGGPRG